MQLNETEKLAVGICDRIKLIFGEKAGSSGIYDVIDDPNHRTFKIRFIAYNYYIVIFSYEKDIIGFSIAVGETMCISLFNSFDTYSDVNLTEYIKKAMTELELRIPDKYLQAYGWL